MGQQDKRMLLTARRLMVGVLWAVAMAAVLSLSLLPGEYEHALCGPWG